MSKNYRQSTLLSMLILFLGFILTRYALFDMHKMKDWPTILFVFCFILIVICFLRKKIVIPLIIALSYIVGFILAYALQTKGVDHGGGATNNLWLIWTITIIVFVLISIIIELLIMKKTNR